MGIVEPSHEFYLFLTRVFLVLRFSLFVLSRSGLFVRFLLLRHLFRFKFLYCEHDLLSLTVPREKPPCHVVLLSFLIVFVALSFFLYRRSNHG